MNQRLHCFRTVFAVLGCVLAFSGVRAAESFTFDDIHYWIGEGTNQAAFVFDWNNGKPNSSIAYGIRWNGASNNLTYWLRRIADEDKRLQMAVSPSQYGTSLDSFAYDADGDGGLFDFVNDLASDPDDFIRVREAKSPWHYWSSTCLTGAGFSPSATWTPNWYGIDGMYVENNGWFGFKYTFYTGLVDIPALPVFAESPFAHQVIASSIDPDMELNADVASVLGKPSQLGLDDRLGTSSVTAVTPVIPAWQSDQVFSLSKTEAPMSGSITIAFDHKVMDNPLNPYGLDFIVFGNFICQGSGGNPVGDPSKVNITSPLYTDGEPGKVEVSQNGVDWFKFTNGPYADTFAPTFGFRYDPDNADVTLYSGNLWWGQPTDPTLPIDPSLTITNFFGKTLAQMSILYNGSAGGTGFDIGGFENLPVDPVTGEKWIQYVRVTSIADYDPDQDGDWTDIDAFADVAPALPYDNWVRENYAWTQLPYTNVVGKSVIANNGKANYYNAAFGTAPTADAVESFAVSNFTIENGKAFFTVPSAEFGFDAFRVGKASEVNGKYSDSLPTHESTVETGSGFESVFSIAVDGTATNAFYKIGLSAE